MNRKAPQDKTPIPKRTLTSTLQRSNSGTPLRKPDSRSSTPVPSTNHANSPSRSFSLSGIAKDSDLTKQADVALNNLETTLQEHTDQLTTKIDQMSARINSLDEMIQDLLRDDFDDPDRSSTPRPSGERRRFSGEPLNLEPETVLSPIESAEPATATTPASAPEPASQPVPKSSRTKAPASSRLTRQASGPTTPMLPLGQDTGASLLAEQSPFFTDRWPRRLYD